MPLLPARSFALSFTRYVPRRGSLTATRNAPTFARVRALGDDLQAALLALLFEDYELERLVRDYLIF